MGCLNQCNSQTEINNVQTRSFNVFYLKKIIYHSGRSQSVRPVNVSEMSIKSVKLYKKSGDVVINFRVVEKELLFFCFPCPVSLHFALLSSQDMLSQCQKKNPK